MNIGFNFICWKILNKDYTPLYWGIKSLYNPRVLNPIIELKIRKSTELENEIKRIRSSCDLSFYIIEEVIEEGYHSYQTEEIAIDQNRGWGKNTTIIAEFIIPKGTLYYENESEYVSETIMMK